MHQGRPITRATIQLLSLAIILMAATGCTTSPLPFQDPDQPNRTAGRAACNLDHLPAQQEFVQIISAILETPPHTVQLTRLKTWTARNQCCSARQRAKIAEQGGNCWTGRCWTALAEARVPPTEHRGSEHVGFYVYSPSCEVYHDYHYRYGWQLGKP